MSEHEGDRQAQRHALVGPGRLWREKREFQRRFLLEQGLRRDDRLLDLGCGTLRGGIPLIQYLQPGHYTGIDVRPEVIAEARLELAEAGLESRRPRLQCLPDLARVSLGDSFDVVWAFSVLIHLSDDALAAALSIVRRHLAEDGTFFANVNLGEEPDGTWQGFPLVWRPWSFYQAAFGRAGLQVTDLGPLTDFGHVSGHSDPERDRQQRMLRADVARLDV